MIFRAPFSKADEVFTLLVTAMAICALWFHVRERRFLARAVLVPGTVVKTNRQLHSARYRYDDYRPFLSFTDTKGASWTFDCGRYKPQVCKVGQTLPVIYDPDDPAGAEVESGPFSAVGYTVLNFTCVGGFLLVMFLGLRLLESAPGREAYPSRPGKPLSPVPRSATSPPMPTPPRIPADLRPLTKAIKTCGVYVALSSLAVGYAAYIYTRQRDFVAHATHVQGKIAGNLHSYGRSNDHYSAIFTFTDDTGKTWEVTDRRANYKLHPYPFRQPCQVLYEPANPAGAQLETPDTFMDTLGYAFVPGLTGTVIGAWALFALWMNYAALRRLRTARADGAVPRDPSILEDP